MPLLSEVFSAEQLAGIWDEETRLFRDELRDPALRAQAEAKLRRYRQRFAERHGVAEGSPEFWRLMFDTENCP